MSDCKHKEAFENCETYCIGCEYDAEIIRLKKDNVKLKEALEKLMIFSLEREKEFVGYVDKCGCLTNENTSLKEMLCKACNTMNRILEAATQPDDAVNEVFRRMHELKEANIAIRELK